MSDDRPVIEVRNVCAGYPGQEVLHNVSLEVAPRSLVAIVGPNGGGKTTLLRLLLGTITPRYGSVRVLGGRPQDVRRRIGYVPQHFLFDAQYPVNVRDVVLSGRIDRTRFGAYRRSDREAAAEALARVGMEALIGRSFSDLSGGERQRVLVAQALATSPELLLLDEPTASVDAAAAQQLHELFAGLSQSMTVLLVSHNLSVVTSRATHVLCVNRTAEVHGVAEMPHSLFRTAFGTDLLLVQHDASCHIIDETAAVSAPHAGQEEP